jgi:hypothetical protein
LKEKNSGVFVTTLYENDNVWMALKSFLPEISIIITVLLHIQQETLAGIFDVSLEQYESFTEGLRRETYNILVNDVSAKV